KSCREQMKQRQLLDHLAGTGECHIGALSTIAECPPCLDSDKIDASTRHWGTQPKRSGAITCGDIPLCAEGESHAWNPDTGHKPLVCCAWLAVYWRGGASIWRAPERVSAFHQRRPHDVHQRRREPETSGPESAYRCGTGRALRRRHSLRR